MLYAVSITYANEWLVCGEELALIQAARGCTSNKRRCVVHLVSVLNEMDNVVLSFPFCRAGFFGLYVCFVKSARCSCFEHPTFPNHFWFPIIMSSLLSSVLFVGSIISCPWCSSGHWNIHASIHHSYCLSGRGVCQRGHKCKNFFWPITKRTS